MIHPGLRPDQGLCSCGILGQLRSTSFEDVVAVGASERWQAAGGTLEASFCLRGLLGVGSVVQAETLRI